MVALLVALIACSPAPYPEYRPLGDGSYLRLITLGEGECTPNDSDRITFTLRAGPMTGDAGSLFSGDRTVVLREIGTTGLGRALRRSHAGDSLSVLIRCHGIPWQALDLLQQRPLNDSLMLDLQLKVARIQDPRSVHAEQERFRGWKALNEAEERETLLGHLREQGIDTASYWHSGMYVLVTDSGSVPHARSGDAVTVAYVGRFLDGRIFDDNHGPDGPLHFQLGDPDQVIHGMEMGLYALGKGGRGTFIIPSALAFGHKGSAMGIVPPFTTVVYEVELLDLVRTSKGGT
ncbi:MAG: FKBP-type peptidyl-prolyl cis-trans isomerase [Flavobacteriales bacterium]|nr:FKBP-type peptidyl-prolyl cis-trans isomerase [Flavobacteriales bacterium]